MYLSVDGGPEASYGYVSNPSALIWIESGAELVVRVAAFDTVGREGPRSDASPPLRLCPGDFDGDEIIENEDRNRALGCLQQPATGACAAAEFVVDGHITNSDILALEVGSYACGEPPGRRLPGGHRRRRGDLGVGLVQGAQLCRSLRGGSLRRRGSRQ